MRKETGTMNSRKITARMISLMARQSLKSSRMRNIFVGITILLASALLTAVLLFASEQKQLEKNQLSVQQQVSYYNLTPEQVTTLSSDGRIAFQIRVKTGPSSELAGFDLIPYYVNQLSDQIEVGSLQQGRLPEAHHEIAAYGAMLDKLGAASILGSDVTLTFSDGSRETFTLTGILKGYESSKQFPVFFSEDYARNGRQLKDAPYQVHAKLDGARAMQAEECRQIMYQIGADAGIAREDINPSKAFLDSLTVDTQSVMIYGLVGLVILLAAILVIYGVFYLSVIGRIHQFGQLRTIGMTRKQIRKMVSREGRRLFLASSPLGIFIGGTAGYFMIPDGFYFGSALSIAALVFVMIYLITMLSVRKPARLAGAVSPMEALRCVSQEPMKKAAAGKLCRRLTPLGLGRINFSKNRKKTAVTMLSLSLGGILFLSAATYISSFDKDHYARQGYFKEAEFNIQYSPSAIELSETGQSGLQARSPLGTQMVREILALDGVTGVREIKSFGIQYDYPKNDLYKANDTISPLTEAEIQALGGYLEDGSADYETLMTGDYILVMDNAVVNEIYGWSFVVGDTITLHYYDGRRMAEKEVAILGVLNSQYVLDHTYNPEGWFLMPEQAVLEMVDYDCINSNLLVSTEADKEAGIEEKLLQMIEKKPELLLETLAERRAAYAQTANGIFTAIGGLSAFIMMFSILSMINTLITNIVTRRQELAMLTSIGMGKGQARIMLLSENLFFVLITLAVTMTAGTLCGYLLCHMLYNHGAYYMAFRFPTAYVLAYVCLLVLVPLAISFAAMGIFSREPLVERLRGADMT